MDSFREFFLRKYPFGIVEQQINREEILTEGLVTSYPIDTLLSMLVRKYGSNIYDISKNFYNDKTKTAGITFFTKKEFANNIFIEPINGGIFLTQKWFNENEKIIVTDVIGKIVSEYVINSLADEIKIPISQLSSGIYFVDVKSEKNYSPIKFCKL